MKYLNIILCLAGTFVSLVTICFCYKKTINNKNKFKLIHYFYMLIFSIIIYLINLFAETNHKIILIFISFIVINKIIFKEKTDKVFIITSLIYIFVFICDFISSFLYLLIPEFNMNNFDAITIYRAVSTIIVSSLVVFLYTRKFILTRNKKLINFLLEKVKLIQILIIFILFIAFYIITFFHTYNANYKTYLFTLILIGIFILFTIILIYEYFKNKDKEKEKQDLLFIIKEYENILQNNSINRHETLNNFVVLKSFKDKSSKEYERLLDDIIKTYQNKKGIVFSNICKLPSGIKGMVYYKFANAKCKTLNIETIISKNINEEIEKINSNLYYKICKIIGILLDNAIESSSQTKEKLILIDIFNENNYFNIYIENSFKGNINMKNIYKKGFSSKGKERGYGLFIVNRIIKSNELLSLDQYIDKKNFISILKIKKC